MTSTVLGWNLKLTCPQGYGRGMFKLVSRSRSLEVYSGTAHNPLLQKGGPLRRLPQQKLSLNIIFEISKTVSSIVDTKISA